MKRIIIACFLLVFLTSCSSKKKTLHKENKKVEQAANKRTSGNYTNYTVLNYISRFKDIAITEMNKYGIPASITMAQAILESGTGNSDLAKYANNHFGIKCTSDWKGKGYYKDDDKSDECFRVYTNPEESFKDHSEFLKRKRYAFLFDLDKDDYKGWANGLKQAGYATNPKYPDLLISLIERYDLHQLDDLNSGPFVNSKNNTVNNSTPSAYNYVVVKGDTLYNISKRFGLSIDELKSLNNMSDNVIKLGQQLIVKK